MGEGGLKPMLYKNKLLKWKVQLCWFKFTLEDTLKKNNYPCKQELNFPSDTWAVFPKG